MMRWATAAIVLAYALCAPAAADPTADAKALSAAFKAAVEAGNVDAVVALYADDAWAIYPGAGEEAHGKAEITRLVRDLLSGPKPTLTPVSNQAFAVDDTHVMNVGRWDVTTHPAGSKPTTAHLRTTELLVKRGDAWLYLVDHASIGTPAPKPPVRRKRTRGR
jgi:uncharacterized protein (TIGR02246 family)